MSSWILHLGCSRLFGSRGEENEVSTCDPLQNNKEGAWRKIHSTICCFFQPFHSTVFILSLQIPSPCLLSFLSRPKLLVLYLTNDFWLVRTSFLVFLSKFPQPHSETQEGGKL